MFYSSMIICKLNVAVVVHANFGFPTCSLLYEETMVRSNVPFVVHVAALLLSTLSCCSTESVYCVTPTQPTGTSCSLCPHNSKCATLSDSAQQAKSFFISNTTMVFLPGDHTLDISITVANISSLTMCGESSSVYSSCLQWASWPQLHEYG